MSWRTKFSDEKNSNAFMQVQLDGKHVQKRVKMQKCWCKTCANACWQVQKMCMCNTCANACMQFQREGIVCVHGLGAK